MTVEEAGERIIARHVRMAHARVKGESQIAEYAARLEIEECARILAVAPQGLPLLAARRDECRSAHRRSGWIIFERRRISTSCLPDEDLEGHHGDDGESHHHGHEVARGLLEGVGHELGEDHPDHGPRRKAQPVR
jgi:hypothetical protein